MTFFLSKCVIIVFSSGKKVAKKYILGVPKLRFFAFFPGQTTKKFFCFSNPNSKGGEGVSRRGDI